ncbi:MAG: MFS transporter [Legionella sp.]
MQQIEQPFTRFESKNNTLLPWIVCFTASLFFFYEFIQGNMFASIADNIMHDFEIRADKMTYLSSIYYLSNVASLFFAGMLLDRYSTKKILVTAMICCVLSTFILAHAQSFYLALGCRFVTGIGSAFCLLGPIRIASHWFPPHRMALVTGSIVTMAMTGGMIAQYPLTKLVIQFGWRQSLIIVACLGVSIVITMIYAVKDKPEGYQAVFRKIQTVRPISNYSYLNSQTLRAALYASLMNMAVAIYGAMMGSLYLMQRLGVSKEQAALVNSMLFLGAILGGPLIGWCSDRLALRTLPMKVGAMVSLLTMLVILYVPVSLGCMGLLFFLLGFFTAAQVISYALVAESSAPEMTAKAVSIVSIFTQGGYIVYQNLFSYFLQQHGGLQIINDVPVYSFADYQCAAIIIPLGFSLALYVAFRLKETYCRQLHG